MMAYAEAPSRRFAYDDDGTAGFHLKGDGTELTALTAGNLATLNDEADSVYVSMGISQPTRYFGVVFPEKRELDGIFAAYEDAGASPSTPGVVETSVDTTTGLDGTWVQQIADLADYGSPGTDWRDNITSLAVSGIQGVRVLMSTSGSLSKQGLSTLHLYGTITPGETVDRLLFLDTSAADATFTAPIDYANVAQGQTADRTFKVKNNSSTYSFTSIQITAEDLTGDAGDWYTFCVTVDGSYSATLDIGTLAAGGEKTIYMRQTIPDAAAVGLHTGRIQLSFGTMV